MAGKSGSEERRQLSEQNLLSSSALMVMSKRYPNIPNGQKDLQSPYLKRYALLFLSLSQSILLFLCEITS